MPKKCKLGTNRRCSSGTDFFNYDAKYAPNKMKICPKFQKKVHSLQLYTPPEKIGANKVPRIKVLSLKCTIIYLDGSEFSN